MVTRNGWRLCLDKIKMWTSVFFVLWLQWRDFIRYPVVYSKRRLETNTYAVNALIVQPKWNEDVIAHKFHSTVLCSTELSSVVEAATGNANKSNKERYGLGSTAAQCDNFAKIKWLDLLTRSSFGAWSFNNQDNIWCIRDVERERVNEQRFYTHSRRDRKEKPLYVDYAKNWDVVLNLQSLVE